MKMVCNVFFFPNGNTAVMREGGQVTVLQKSWLLHFAEFLESQNVDLCGSTFILPNGSAAKIMLDDKGGYTWRIETPKGEKNG